jgi:hypothetical protein
MDRPGPVTGADWPEDLYRLQASDLGTGRGHLGLHSRDDLLRPGPDVEDLTEVAQVLVGLVDADRAGSGLDVGAGLSQDQHLDPELGQVAGRVADLLESRLVHSWYSWRVGRAVAHRGEGAHHVRLQSEGEHVLGGVDVVGYRALRRTLVGHAHAATADRDGIRASRISIWWRTSRWLVGSSRIR